MDGTRAGSCRASASPWTRRFGGVASRSACNQTSARRRGFRDGQPIRAAVSVHPCRRRWRP